MALRLPRVLASPRSRHPVRGEQRRLRLRHRDHPAAATTRASGSSRSRSRPTTATRSATSTASRTPGTSCSTSCATGSRRWASAPVDLARIVEPGTRGRTRRMQARTRCVLALRGRAAAAGRVLDLGCGRRRLAEELRAPGHYVVGVDVATAPRAPVDVDRFVVADLERACPSEVGGRAVRRRRSPPTCSSTSATPTPARASSRCRCARGDAHRERPEHRPLVPARCGSASAASTTTSAASSTRRISASSPGAASRASPSSSRLARGGAAPHRASARDRSTGTRAERLEAAGADARREDRRRRAELSGRRCSPTSTSPCSTRDPARLRARLQRAPNGRRSAARRCPRLRETGRTRTSSCERSCLP